MSAQVESMFYDRVQKPWHNLGKALSGDTLISTKQAIIEAGCDWEVGLKPMFVANQAGDYVEVPERYTYRKTDGQLLGCVGPRYHPLQNVDAFDWFQPFLDNKLCTLDTAGSLDEGRKVWVLARINSDPIDVTKNDPVCPFLLPSNSHDGTMSVRVGFSVIRVVCINTLRAAIGSTASKLIRLRHHKDVKSNLENLREVIDVVNRDFKASAEQYKLLCNKTINRADLIKYVRTCLEIDEKTIDKDISTRTLNTMTSIVQRFEDEKKNVGPTAWATYNAWNSYLNWDVGRSTSNRLDSLWFGQNQTKDQKAFELALAL